MSDTAILAKIKKLLNLTTERGATEAEAASAAAKAAEFLREHKLSLASVQAFDLDAGQGAVTENRIDPARKSSWSDILIVEVCHTYGTKPVKSFGQYRIIGRPDDIAVTEALYQWIAQQIIRLTAAYEGKGRTAKHSFAYGCAQTVCRRLREQRAATTANIDPLYGALVVQDDEAVKKYISDNVGRLQKGRRSVRVRDHASRSAGHTAGKSVGLGHRGVGQTQACLP